MPSCQGWKSYSAQLICHTCGCPARCMICLAVVFCSPLFVVVFLTDETRGSLLRPPVKWFSKDVAQESSPTLHVPERVSWIYRDRKVVWSQWMQHVAACCSLWFLAKKHFFQLEWSLRFSFITMNRCAKDLLSRQSLTAFSFNLFEAMAGVDLAHGDGSRRYSLPTWTTCLLQLAKQTQANGKMTVTKHKSTCWWWNMNDLFAKGRHLKVVVGGLFEGLNESQRHAEACTLLLRP